MPPGSLVASTRSIANVAKRRPVIVNHNCSRVVGQQYQGSPRWPSTPVGVGQSPRSFRKIAHSRDEADRRTSHLQRPMTGHTPVEVRVQ